MVMKRMNGIVYRIKHNVMGVFGCLKDNTISLWTPGSIFGVSRNPYLPNTE
jgi:hypothetical protein